MSDDQNQPQPQPPQPPQPPVPPTPYVAQPGQPGVPHPQYAPSQEVPGQVTGIIGLVLAFVGLAPIGLILSIISVVQASKARASKVLGIVGIVINALGIVLVGLWLALVVFAAYFGVQERAKEAGAQVSVTAVSRSAEAFYTKEGKYPQTIQDFAKYPESTLPESSVAVTNTLPHDSSSVMYQACGDMGAEVVSYSYDDDAPVYEYLGTGSVLTCAK